MIHGTPILPRAQGWPRVTRARLGAMPLARRQWLDAASMRLLCNPDLPVLRAVASWG